MPPGSGFTTSSFTALFLASLCLAASCSAFVAAPRHVTGVAARPQASVLPYHRGVLLEGRGLGGVATDGRRGCAARRHGSNLLRMETLGPIGPFCPFRSEYCSTGAMDRDMGTLSSLAQDVSRKFQGLMVGMQGGMPPEKEAVLKIATEMEEMNEQWVVLLTRLRLADDFQALQFFKLSEAKLAKSGVSLDDMQKGVVWQIEGLKAFAENRMPPPMPEELQKAFEKQQKEGGGV